MKCIKTRFVLILLGAILCSCETRKIRNKLCNKTPDVFALFEKDNFSKDDLDVLWLHTIRNIENTKLDNVSDELLDQVAGNCHSFSNALVHVGNKMLGKKQDVYKKEQLLQLSSRIVNFTRKVRDMLTERNKKLQADTIWLTVSYNDKQLNILSLMNSIAFDNCDNIDVVKHYLCEIVLKLNEDVDANTYYNMLDEMSYDSPDLLNKFHKKLNSFNMNALLYIDNEYLMRNIQKFTNYINQLVIKDRNSKKSPND